MRTKFLLCLVFLSIPMVLSACQLMPDEDILPASPILYSYEVQDYQMAQVIRSDLIETITVNCNYMPTKEESLSFSLGGIYIDKVYVSEGQQVKAGQLLAELEQDNLQYQIADLEYQLEVLKLKEKHILEIRELDLRKHDIIMGEITWNLENTKSEMDKWLEQKEKQETRLEDLEEEYAKKLQNSADAIYLQKLQLEDKKTSLKARQIIAGFDGTITYARKVTEGMRSVKGERFFTISDLDTMVFTVTGENVQYFPVGMEVILTCQEKEMEACVVDASELDLAEKPDSEQQVAYLKLKQPDPALKDGAKGKIRLILEERRDVLCINEDAVKTADGETFVYMPDENGMRVMQKVTTGLQVEDMIEIIDGLKEGDVCIID